MRKNCRRLTLITMAATLMWVSSCSKKTETPAETSSAQPAAQPTSEPAPQPAAQPATAPPAASQPAQQAAAPQTPAAQPSPAPAETAEARKPAPPPPPPPKPKTFTIPPGTTVSVRTTSTLSTKTNQQGEGFSASLASPLVVHGVTIARRGAPVSGTIVTADPGGRVKGRASMALAVSSVQTVDGQSLQLPTTPWSVEAKSTKKKDAMKVGIGAGAGAIIGAIAGGGKGAAIGSAVGGGAGAGTVMATRGDPAVVPSETVIQFQTAGPASVTEAHPGSIAGTKKSAAPAEEEPPPSDQQ
jgi:hypothetical protein